MTADYINPFLVSTVAVFEQMLMMQLERQAPYIRKSYSPQFDVTGIIGLTGRATGTVAVGMPREMALRITGTLLGNLPTEINAQVVDAVGEVTNMIAGGAKSRLERLELSLGLPTVLIGKSACVAFPSRTTPISIPFSCDLGSLVVEVGILG